MVKRKDKWKHQKTSWGYYKSSTIYLIDSQLNFAALY